MVVACNVLCSSMAKGDSWAGYFSGGGLLTHLGWLRGLETNSDNFVPNKMV